MQPTLKLRWKKDELCTSNDPQVINGCGERMVLQQWWKNEKHESIIGEEPGEWRDVPMETD